MNDNGSLVLHGGDGGPIGLDGLGELLAETKAPVALIAETLGFDDSHAFSRQFKRHRGVSPSEHRKQSRKKT